MAWSCLVPLVAALSLTPQAAPKAEVKLVKPVATIGEVFRGTVVLTIPEGLHGYQNPPSKDYMIPVTLQMDNKELKLWVKYPKGTDEVVGGDPEPAKVYSGTIEIPFAITSFKKPGKVVLKLGIKHQVCNATACFPPETIALDTPITIVAGGKS